jgi:group I intron endonuclease
MIKYGAAQPTMFKLEILEYCSGRRSHPTEKCIKIEQHFINLLQPEYNILQIAGSSLGFYHSDQTLCKMSATRMGIGKGTPKP